MSAVGIIFSNLHDMSIPELTSRRTMASVPFGCRYRLIDFTLSNMVNSGISNVNVITHYNYQSLMDHIGSGKDWDLARRTGGLKILPPYITAFSNDTNSLYTTRLEALKSVYATLSHMTDEYIVLSDCDSICNIDIGAMIADHVKNGADITVGVKNIKVSAERSAYYNIVSSNANGELTDITIHPKEFDGNADICINMWVAGRRYLQSMVLDAISHGFSNFNRDIIVRGIGKSKIRIYRHNGYYANINSMTDYYDISMSMLDEKNREDLFKVPGRPIFTKVRNSAPTKYASTASVSNSLIADGCIIEGSVENSILFRGVRVGKGAVVKNCILFQDTQVLSNSYLNCIITDKNVVIRDVVMLSGHSTMPLYIEKSKMI